MSIYESLMQQIRQQNQPQAHLINDANSFADTLGSMPPSDPMHAFNAHFGMGVAGAPPEMSTLQAIGQAFPGAMDAVRQTENVNMQRQQQSMQMRQVASDTIQAVDKYNFEKEAMLHKLRHQDEILNETKRHNINTEHVGMLGAQAHLMTASKKDNLLGEVAKDRMKSALKGGNDFDENWALLRKLTDVVRDQGFTLPWIGNPSMVKQINSQLPKDYQIELNKTEGANLKNVKDVAMRLVLNKEKARFTELGYKDGQSEDQIQQQWNQLQSRPDYLTKIEDYVDNGLNLKRKRKNSPQEGSLSKNWKH